MQFTIRLSRAEKYPAKQHAQRVAARLGCEDGLIYLIGQYAYNVEDSDRPRKWLQRRYFYYMSGVNEANACLTYNCKTHELVLYLEEIDWEREIWTGRGSTIEEAKERYDVDDVRWNPQLFPDLRMWLESRSQGALMHILHDQHAPKGIKNLPLESKSLLHIMDHCRAVKDLHEIRLIERANEISAAAHKAVLQRVGTAINEAQLSGVFQDECISRFAEQAYDPIVGSGPNASTLHYTANNESLMGRQLICIDAGAAFDLYASDVTRTFPINGVWTKEARAVYDIVRQMQENAIAGAVPGAFMLDLHYGAARTAIEGLLSLGILHNGTADEIESTGTIRGFYPHGLGHHLGLETHDCLSVPLLRYPKGKDSDAEGFMSTDPFPGQQGSRQSVGPEHLAICSEGSPCLVPGNVVTVEPGLYFNRSHLTRNYLQEPKHSRYINNEILDQYWGVGGVRIEDDILITKEGNRNLTIATKDPDELCKIICDAKARLDA